MRNIYNICVLYIKVRRPKKSALLPFLVFCNEVYHAVSRFWHCCLGGMYHMKQYKFSVDEIKRMTKSMVILAGLRWNFSGLGTMGAGFT